MQSQQKIPAPVLIDDPAAVALAEPECPEHLLDFIPAVTPSFDRPEHLAGLVDDIEAAFTRPLESYCTVPPRHYKTETLIHGIGWGLRRWPETPVLYATHTATFANKQSKRAKKIARAAGVELELGSNRADEWYTTAGGGLVARGVGGEVTGRGFKVIIVDDPIKNREQAESQIFLQKTADWLEADIFSRGTPDVAILVIHARWHPRDPIGRLIEKGWKGRVLRAVAEEGDTDGRKPGEALCPKRWPLPILEQRKERVGPYNWASLYQGRPRPRGGTIFGDAKYYDVLPQRYHAAYGVDLAYTAKTSACYSVCLRLLFDGEFFYVHQVRRDQVLAPEFASAIKGMYAARPGVMVWHCATSEMGSGQFIQRALGNSGRHFVMELASSIGDPYVRAQDIAADWNAGKVLVPNPENYDAPWLADFLSEVQSFTGVSDTYNDQVVALASARTAVFRKPAARNLGGYQA